MAEMDVEGLVTSIILTAFVVVFGFIPGCVIGYWCGLKHAEDATEKPKEPEPKVEVIWVDDEVLR